MYFVRILIMSLSFIFALNGVLDSGLEEYVIQDNFDSLSHAVMTSDIDKIQKFLEIGYDINKKSGCWSAVERAIEVFGQTNDKPLDDKFTVLCLLFDKGAIIDRWAYLSAKYIENKEIKEQVLNLLDMHLLGSTARDFVMIEIAVENDRPLVIKILLQSNKIKLEDVKKLYLKAVKYNSKKVGKFLLNILRVLDASGNVSKSGFAAWNIDDKSLPIEMIHYIARSMD